MKVQKLDKRHSGNHYFKYYVVSTKIWAERYQELQYWREWCWTTFGPAAELNTVLMMRNDRDWMWAWDTGHNNCRLYLKSDAELSWFSLKWA